MSAGDSEGLQGAGISPRERLERIELVLERIDRKLDGKADRVDLMALEIRVRELELHGTAQSQEVAARVDALAVEITAIGRRLIYAAGIAASLAIAVEIVRSLGAG